MLPSTRVQVPSTPTQDGPSYAGSRWALYYCLHSHWPLGVRGSPRRFLSMMVDLEMNRDRDMDMAGTHIRGRRQDTTMGVTTSTTTAYATPSSTSTSNGPIDWGKRREEVRAGFVHVMKGYKTHAFPHDELLAVSGGFSDKYVFAMCLPCHLMQQK